MKPILGRIMMANDPNPVMGREEKDYANYQKQQWHLKLEKEKQQFHRKQQDIRQINLHHLSGNIEGHVDQNGQKQMIGVDKLGNQTKINLDYNTISKQNPITGEVIFYQNGEKVRVNYQNRKEIPTRHVEPDGGFKAKHAANKEELNKGQKLKRNKEAEDFLWRTAKEEEQYRPTLQVKDTNPWNMKSGEKDLFEVRHQDRERHEKIYGESTLERKLIEKKGRTEHSNKMVNQSMDYRDLDIQHLNKIKPAFYESYDFSLAGPGNHSDQIPKPFPVMDAKKKIEDIQTLQFNRSQQIDPIFKSKGRGLEHLHQQSQQEVQLVQNKQRVEQRPTYDSLDKHIQALKRTDEMGKQFQPTPEIQIKLKKRIPTPGGHGEERQQPLLPRRAGKKIDVYE